MLLIIVFKQISFVDDRPNQSFNTIEIGLTFFKYQHEKNGPEG